MLIMDEHYRVSSDLHVGSIWSTTYYLVIISQLYSH